MGSYCAACTNTHFMPKAKRSFSTIARLQFALVGSTPAPLVGIVANLGMVIIPYKYNGKDREEVFFINVSDICRSIGIGT